MRVQDSVTLLQLRRDYDERLEKEKIMIKQEKAELEEAARRAEKKAHRDAVAETSFGLTKLRQQQQAKLRAHDKMHQAAEAEKMAAAARAVQLETQHGQEVQRTREKTRVEGEMQLKAELKAADERHQEQMRRQAESLEAAAQRRLDEANELKRRETVRADKLQKELDAAKGDAKAARTQVERTKKEKEEALREAASKALAEKNVAIQAERDKAETARRTAAQAEAVRAEVVKLRSQQADEVTALATQALKVAQTEKETAESRLRQAEHERAEHAKAKNEMELLREEGRDQVEKAKKMMAKADERIRAMEHAMELQQAALDAVRHSAETEKLALMKAAEESKAAALLAVAEERAAEKATAEAAKAKRAATAALAEKLGVSKEAFSPPPADDDDDVPAPTPPLAAPSGATAGAPASAADLQAMSQQVEAALASAEKEHKLAAKAEQRVAELEQEVALLQAKVHLGGKKDSSVERKIAKLAREAEAAKLVALRRLREATRTEIAPMDEVATAAAKKRALSVAGCEVLKAVLLHDTATSADAIRALPEKAQVGIACGVRIPAVLAETAGFGNDKGATAPEAVFVLVASAGAASTLVTGVAMALPRKGETPHEWIIKYMVEDDQVPSPSWLGEKQVTIASRWGVVVARGQVTVEARAADVAASRRYEHDAGGAAATKVQAKVRGKAARKTTKKAKGEAQAATKVQAATRGKLARQATAELLHAEPNSKPMFFIATRKPLICRAGHEISSERVGELEPDTRVFVVETRVMPDGSERARVQKEGDAQPFGWLTASKDGATSLCPVE